MNSNDSLSTAISSDKMYLLVGTNTSENGSKGIYLYSFDTKTGESDSLTMVELDNPSYLTLSPNEKNIYAVSESGDKSMVNALSFDKEKPALTVLNRVPAGGADPCYITIDKEGKSVFTANYTGGSISAFQLNDKKELLEENAVIQFSGKGVVEGRQSQSHLHSVRFSPDGKYLFATDLGADKIYRFETLESVFEGQPAISQSSLKEIDVVAGTGPRHFDFHPNGKYVYLIGELSGKVTVFDYNGGDLSPKQTVVADSVGAMGSADIHVSPDGRFLYASNRLQADGIAIFSINQADGTLVHVGYQLTSKHPRNFVISPNGRFLLLAGRDDNKIQVYKIDEESGLLTDTSQDIKLSKPVCLKFAGI